MSFKVYPYKQGSASAKTLAVALGGKVLKREGSKYKPKPGDVVVNWGASDFPDFYPALVLNKDVSVAQCKLATFEAIGDRGNVVRMPDYWAGKEDFLRDPEYPVVCRTKLRGHSGEGIVIANTREELVDALLYTKYIKKKDEYRVHVFGDDVIFIQRKARKLDVEEPNWQVRNLAGGFVFVEVREEDVPHDVIRQALGAVEALGLDFGGVDVLFNDKEQKAYVLEANTACGLEQRTAERYKQALLDSI